MNELHKEIVNEVLPKAYELTPAQLLEEERNSIALKITGLDEISLPSIYVLAKLYQDGASSNQSLQDFCESLGITPNLSNLLDPLKEFGFLTQSQSTGDMEITQKGKQAAEKIANNMIIRKRLEAKRQLQRLNELYEKLGEFNSR